MSVVFRPAVPADLPEVRRITRDAYLRAGHFAADHPYMGVLEDVEHRAEHAQVWVAEAAGTVVAAVTLTFAGQPYSEIATDGELEFRMLALDPAHQGGGVGRAVPWCARSWSTPGSCRASERSASPAPRSLRRAHSLYRWLGFRRTPERDWYVPGQDVLQQGHGPPCLQRHELISPLATKGRQTASQPQILT
ncbi:GNAT family N-acetyltransferase [Arthrobacter sp. PGP41]|uniref:GNAT family N-acetyltransferase n=1 Tax=Arthrobacter sp. PGP41 TaxID=2079227 RepID=UPI002685CED9|nr:GNAT family N-acetyltransferase [Arthrobacter sp. PGP41]